ncbi:LAGLIDADG family homing endonuclease [Intestinibacter sp.]|uniref:LAGLIDADG family homing endonuclease n=1 Tax=Intestinibacter sp. TaxID=1965304 RepID=UPI003F19193D
MKDVYAKYECNQNAMNYFFAEKGYIKRGNLRNSKIKKDIFSPINTPEAAYILGFYIADGCVNGNKFVITLSEKDKEILEKIRDYMSPVTKLCYKPERVNKTGITTHPMYSFSFACKEIVSRLEELGLGQKKTYLEKSIKNIVPKELMWDFIRGYWDGDGNINSSEVTKSVILKNGETTSYQYTNIGFTIISKDPLILEELNEFFLESGISTHVYPDSRGNYLVGTHSKSEVEKIYNNLYTSSNLYLNRKRIKFDEIMKIPR